MLTLAKFASYLSLTSVSAGFSSSAGADGVAGKPTSPKTDDFAASVGAPDVSAAALAGGSPPRADGGSAVVGAGAAVLIAVVCGSDSPPNAPACPASFGG